MNKSSLIVVLTITIDIIICFCVDSIYCSVSWFLIFLAVIPQMICLYLLLQGNLPTTKEDKKSFSREHAIIFIFAGFFGLYSGNLGVNEQGRTTDCPNTWLQYLFSE